MKNCLVLYTAMCLLMNTSMGQNLEKIGSRDMLKVSGGLNVSSVLYNANGIQGRRQPFTYFVNGNITASLLDISMPLNFSYNNNQWAYSQNYNINSFNPHYKWIKTTFGNTSLNFSPYTLSSHLFSGGGIELNPKWFRFGIMYGRFKKAVEYDVLNNSEDRMSYRRMGAAAYVGIEKENYAFKSTVFHAKDDPGSLSFIPYNSVVKPMENTAVSVSARTMLYRSVSLEGEYAMSALTRNTQVPLEISKEDKALSSWLLEPNATTQIFSAYKISGGYRLGSFGLNLNYERIDPDYQTLGAYYFNNDLENITLAPSLSIFSGKLNISANTGLQRNNLSNDKLNTTKRWVGSFVVAFIPNRKWSVNASYSNFTTFTRQRPQSDPFYRNTLDTMNFYQLTQNANVSANHTFGNAERRQSLFVSGNYLVSGQQAGTLEHTDVFSFNTDLPIPVKTSNVNCGYMVMFKPKGMTVSAIMNWNDIRMNNGHTVYAGPGTNFSYTFHKGLVKWNIGSTYNLVYQNNTKNGEVIQTRCGLSFTPKANERKTGLFSFSLNTGYLLRLSQTDYSEFTGNVGLNYSF